MNRHLGMICQQCDIVESVRDGTGMTEPDLTILTVEENDQCARFLREHAGHEGAAFCLFDVQELAQA